jgi:hypothetical protein
MTILPIVAAARAIVQRCLACALCDRRHACPPNGMEKPSTERFEDVGLRRGKNQKARSLCSFLRERILALIQAPSQAGRGAWRKKVGHLFVLLLGHDAQSFQTSKFQMIVLNGMHWGTAPTSQRA